MSSFFQDLIDVARPMVEAVHATPWRVFPMERVGGPNGKLTQSPDIVPFPVEGLFYIESQGDLDRFRPDPSARAGGSQSLNKAQEVTVSITADPGKIKKGYVLHSLDDDRWYSVHSTDSDGAGNIICGISITKKL